MAKKPSSDKATAEQLRIQACALKVFKASTAAFCFLCVCFCLVVPPSRYIIGVVLLGLLLPKIINGILKRWERKKKQDDERELREKKREEEMNEVKQKSELKQRRLNEKKQRMNEKMQEEKRNLKKRR